MKRTSLVALLVLVPAGAFAQMAAPKQERSTPIEFGVRLAYAIPFGKFTDTPGDDLSQIIKHDLPLTFDLNYRFVDQFLAGVYFSYGFGSLGDSFAQLCASGGASCSVHTLRVGIGGYYHLMPQNKYDPWLGASVGYEQTKASVSGPGGSGDVTISGAEFNFQAGLDYRFSPLFAAGPYVSQGFGQYRHIDAPSNSGDISNKALHGWFSFGLRISFTP